MDGAELLRVFEAVSVICTLFQTRRDHQQDAYKLAAGIARQTKLPVDLAVLATFKFLLPGDISFEYVDTPFYAEVGERPRPILIFEFADKARFHKGTVLRTPQHVHARVEKFRKALAEYLSGHTIAELAEGAAKLVPPPLKFEDPERATPEPDGENSFEFVFSSLRDQAAAVRAAPARPAVYGDTPPQFRELVAARGIEKLYSHQTHALESLAAGRHVVVTTSTSSGKTLIFQLPVLSALESGPGLGGSFEDEAPTALFIYPTKALAQDQCRSFREAAPEHTVLGTFDGDTPIDERERLREHGRVLFANPDILHVTIMPKWQQWQRFLENLRYVVVDELHVYGGVFGASVGMILRRLRRLCMQIGNDSLRFVTCSATIQRPRELMAGITGINPEDIDVIDNDGSPAALKHYLYMTSNFSVPDDPNSGRLHPITKAAPIMVDLLAHGKRVIAFCQLRRACEYMMRAVREELQSRDREDLLRHVMSYRGGYTASDRREIERGMFSGDLRGIVATSAIEVGVDIGHLDAVVIVGFPFSLASFRQQVGRVGRRNKESLVIYVANGSTMDMSYIDDPDRIFNDPDPVVPLAMDESIVAGHLRCSAYELALDDSDAVFFPGDWRALTQEHLNVDERGLYHCPMKWLPNPASNVNIRSVETVETAVIDITNNSNKVIEMIEFSRVGFCVYEGAVYVNQGKPYIVVELDPGLAYAKVQRTAVKWTTRQRDFTDVDPLFVEKTKVIGANANFNAALGRVKKTTIVFGYFKVDRKQKIIDEVELDLPPYTKRGVGMWVNLPTITLDVLTTKRLNAAGAIHAAEHAMMSLMPQFVASSPTDFGTECKAPEKEFAKRQTTRIRPARLIFYERHSADIGHGLFGPLYSELPKIFEAAAEVVDNCKCNLGCASCVAHPNCSERNAVLSKWGAQLIFRIFLNRSFDDIPDGPEPNLGDIRIATVSAIEAPALVPRPAVKHGEEDRNSGANAQKALEKKVKTESASG